MKEVYGVATATDGLQFALRAIYNLHGIINGVFVGASASWTPCEEWASCFLIISLSDMFRFHSRFS